MINIARYSLDDHLRDDDVDGDYVLYADVEPLQASIKEALKKTIEAIYFDDSVDYQRALWQVILILGGEALATAMHHNEADVYKRYCGSYKP